MNESEKRAKEVYPDATSYVFDGGCCILPKPSVAYFERISGWFDVESSAWHDAASRLPKATTDHEFVWRADSEQCSVCGENHHGCIIVKQPSVSPVDEGEAPPQTFEHPVDELAQGIIDENPPTSMSAAYRYVAKDLYDTINPIGRNAAKASSPAVAGRESEKKQQEER